jgi:2-haloacid dehalogenase
MIDTIVFDLGGVLIDWDPRYVYRDVFDTEEKVEWFLREICHHDWNVQQDAGRSLAAATDLLVARHPDWEAEIRLFYDRWEDMLGGPIPETVALLQALHAQQKHRLYALTNWSAETFPVALERYDFLSCFEGILVSGTEKLIKPDRRIYDLLFARFDIQPATALFMDDSLPNVEASRQAGMRAIHVQSPAQLQQELKQLGLLK